MLTFAVIDSLPFGVLITDEQLRITHLNNWVRNGLAYPLADWQGRPLYDVFPEIKNRNLDQIFNLVLQSEQKITISTRIHHYFLEMPGPAGSGCEHMPQSAVVGPLVVEGKVIGTISVINDVTDRQATEEALLREINQMARLHQVDSTAASLDMRENLAAIIQQTKVVLRPDYIGIYLANEGHLQKSAIDGLSDEEIPIEGLANWSFRLRRSRFQTYPDPRHQQNPARRDALQEMVTPLWIGEHCFGALLIGSTRPNGLEADDLKLLEAMGHHAAISIHNAQLHSESEYWRGYYRQINARLQTLLNSIRLMVSHLDPAALINESAGLIAEVFHAETVAFFTPNPLRNQMQAAAVVGNNAEFLKTIVLDADSVKSWLAVQGEAGFLEEISTLLRQFGGTHLKNLCTLIYSALRIRGELEGLLVIVPNENKCQLDDNERELLDALSSQLGLALENALLFTRQQALVVTDGLTGVYNRRKFDEDLARWVNLAQRSGRPVGLIILDIDDFKSFNDTYGHPAGDDLLRLLAKLMVDNFRSTDLVARYGGEEFAIILPDLNKTQTALAAERMCRLIAEQLQLPETPNGPIRRATVSVGVASAPEDANTTTQLVAVTDQALYQAKHKGKNRVEVA